MGASGGSFDYRRVWKAAIEEGECSGCRAPLLTLKNKASANYDLSVCQECDHMWAKDFDTTMLPGDWDMIEQILKALDGVLKAD